MSIAIQAESIRKRLDPSGFEISLSLSIGRGEIVGLFGPNSSGKTVAIKLLAGLFSPDQGEIFLNGYSLAQERTQAQQQVAALIHEPGATESHFPICDCRGLANSAQAKALSSALNLEMVLDHPWEILSYGIQRRVALTQTLCADAPILLLDEPTLGLDESAAQHISHHLRTLARAKTVVIATCQPRLAREICNRIIVLDKGRIVADAPVNRTPRLSQPAAYKIRVKGILGKRWGTWFNGAEIRATGSETIIHGVVADQPALHSILIKIRDLGLCLVSVECLEPALDRSHDTTGTEILGG